MSRLLLTGLLALLVMSAVALTTGERAAGQAAAEAAGSIAEASSLEIWKADAPSSVFQAGTALSVLAQPRAAGMQPPGRSAFP